ncbi:MAG TPA: hypothetical protein VKB30_11435 [Candidatus Limnocylindrales bacterium]|nr:hypothetical protein [Candidatus Limnocylindrales bacterium]
MTTERSSFEDQGSDAGAMGDEALGTVDAVVGTREDEMTSTGLSDAPPTTGSEYDWNRGSRGTSAGTTGSGSGDRLQSATSNVVDRVSNTAQQQVGTTVDTQLGRGADMLTQVSNAIRQSGEQVRGEQPQIASFADTAAQQVDRASEYLRQTDFQGVLRGAEDFARRQPAMFLGGAFALGLVASRFLKASPSGGQGQFGGSSGYRSYGGSYGARSYGGGSYGSGSYGGSSYGGGSYGSGSGMYGSSGTQQANYGGERGTSPYGDTAAGARYADAGSGATSDQGAENGGA